MCYSWIIVKIQSLFGPKPLISFAYITILLIEGSMRAICQIVGLSIPLSIEPPLCYSHMEHLQCHFLRTMTVNCKIYSHLDLPNSKPWAWCLLAWLVWIISFWVARSQDSMYYIAVYIQNLYMYRVAQLKVFSEAVIISKFILIDIRVVYRCEMAVSIVQV